MGTATKVRSVTLRDYELRRLRDARRVCVVRAMPKQPECLGIPATARLAGSCYTFTHDGYWWATKSKPPGEVGDTVAVKEAWQKSGIGWGNNLKAGKVHYRASDNGEWKPYWGKWRSPATMPLWAVRTFATLVDVRVGQVQGVTEAEAVEAGISYPDFRHLPPDDLPDIAPTDIFADQHNAHTRNPAHKWEANPWCFIGVFQLRGDE